MYQKILVALDNSTADESLLPHVVELAKALNSELLLVHVADGWVARHYADLMLKDSEEMIKDRQYLEKIHAALRQQNLRVESLLAMGEPAVEILNIATEKKCDLIAMTSHGHRFFADLVLGSTIEEVRHQAQIPLLIVRQKHNT